MRILCSILGVTLAAGLAAAEDGKVIDAKAPAGKGGYKIESGLRLGGGEAPDNAQFYEKAGRTDVDADAQGNLYVLDSGGPRIQVFDAQGKFIRSLGKQGEGPGEMKMPARLAVARDGRIAVFDMALQRISLFDPQGELIRDQLTQGPVQDLAWDAQGHLVVTSSASGGDQIEAFDAGGKSVWSTTPPAAAPAPGGRRIMIEMGNETVAPRLALAANGDVFNAGREEYGVRRLHQGTVQQTWKRAYDRQPRQEMPRRREGEEGEGGGQVVMIRRTEGGGGAAGTGSQTSVSTSHDGSSTMTFSMDEIEKMLPKNSPDVRGLLAWADGRLWVLTSTNDGDQMVVDEWSDRGEYSKRFAIPASYSRLRIGSDGKLYGVSHDADEYPVVHRLNVTPVLP